MIMLHIYTFMVSFERPFFSSMKILSKNKIKLVPLLHHSLLGIVGKVSSIVPLEASFLHRIKRFLFLCCNIYYIDGW